MGSRYLQTPTVFSRPVRRRQVLVAGAGLGAAAILAACGSSPKKSAGGGDKSGLLVQPVDSTRQAKRGGMLKRSATSDVASWDAHLSGATVVGYYEFAYGRLFSLKPGYMEASKDEISGDILESWEWSPDHLQLTAKLRPNVKFHRLPPMNGRELDIDDILFSWKRFAAQGSNRTVVANSANPNAPILSITAPDPHTLLIKFKEPLVYVQSYLTSRSYLNIVPKESENIQTIDLRTGIFGTGPYALTNYQPSIGMTFKRHLDYWDKEHPYVDQIDYPIVQEYAAGLAQFRTGNIHTYAVRQEEILGMKAENKDLLMYVGDVVLDTPKMFFGWKDASPIRDKRVRQAFSMSIARDDWINAQYNCNAFTSAGLSIEKRWHTALQATETDWWLNPKSSDFGPNSKYFSHDVAEAKKLLSAAGFGANGPEITSNHFTSTQYGSDFPKLVELWESMAAESGIRIKTNVVDYNTEFLSTIRDTPAKFTGLSYKTGPPAPTSDAVDRLSYEFSPKSGIGFNGFDVDGKGDGSGDPYVEQQLQKGKGEFDVQKRKAIVHDLQRYLAEQQYAIRFPGGATSFALVWPALRNYNVYYPGSALASLTANTTWWLDDSLPPLKKA